MPWLPFPLTMVGSAFDGFIVLWPSTVPSKKANGLTPHSLTTA